MEFKGTKGKWTASEIMNFSDTLVSFIENKKGKSIAQTRGCITGEEKEAKANANLIMASKDLLFACNRAKEDIKNGVADEQTIIALENAINKAIGD